MKNKFVFLFFLSFILSSGISQNNRKEIYSSGDMPIEKRVEDLLSKMTLEEKIEQLSGIGFDTKENKRLNIPAIKMTDGPAGARWGKSTAFPSPISMAASWDTSLIRQVGIAMAKETKAHGRNYLLAPCVNIHRFPLGGRNFESYGEDPFLASRIAVSMIQGIQSENVLSSVKHFACNNQEWSRFKVNVIVDERTLREIYLPAFKAAVQEAHVWTVMAAYNKVNGFSASQNKYLLTDVLKKEWGFDGIAISDWGAVKTTVESANAGLDLEMPFAKHWGNKLLTAVKNGEVSREVIDDKVRRILRIIFRSGIYDHSIIADTSEIVFKANTFIAKKMAAEGMVLLKNNNHVLPINNNEIKTIAIIGPNAAYARTGGGGSSNVKTYAEAIPPLEAITKNIGSNMKVLYAYGSPIEGEIMPLSSEFMKPVNATIGNNGLLAEYFNNKNLQGNPIYSQLDKQIDFYWGYDPPNEKLHGVNDDNIFSIRWSGKLIPPVSGTYKINVMNNDGIRVFINNSVIIDSWKPGKYSLKTASIEMEVGKNYDLRIEYFQNDDLSEIHFGWEKPNEDLIQEAVDAAKKSDIAIVFVGLSPRMESESFDRKLFSLDDQNKLISAVANVNKKTVVVLNTGGPIAMNTWMNNVPSIIEAWYPGQECGNAITDILFGKINPSGKLPFSFIKRTEDSPAFVGYKDTNLISTYSEGIFVGYRYLEKNNIESLYPFGHGLSYTSFEYSNMVIKTISELEYEVSVDIKNNGLVAGSEVIQLYVKDKDCSIERPEKELKGFKKVFLESGKQMKIQIRLKKDAFAFYDVTKKDWKIESGKFQIILGSSSKDVRLMQEITIN